MAQKSEVKSLLKALEEAEDRTEGLIAEVAGLRDAMNGVLNLLRASLQRLQSQQGIVADVLEKGAPAGVVALRCLVANTWARLY